MTQVEVETALAIETGAAVDAAETVCVYVCVCVLHVRACQEEALLKAEEEDLRRQQEELQRMETEAAQQHAEAVAALQAIEEEKAKLVELAQMAEEAPPEYASHANRTHAHKCASFRIEQGEAAPPTPTGCGGLVCVLS